MSTPSAPADVKSAISVGRACPVKPKIVPLYPNLRIAVVAAGPLKLGIPNDTGK